MSADFTRLVDLADRRLGGSVVAANDELFADRENLITHAPPAFQPYTFGHKGQVMDGWESRRRREPGHDWAVVALGIPGVVRGVVVDTSYFTGNYPPEVSVEGAGMEGHPTPAELAAADWVPLVARTHAKGDTRNAYPVDVEQRFTHVRLCQYPDGGVARLRVHGEPVVDPRFLPAGAIDLVALENGGAVVGCSNMFYSSPTNLIAPGEARVMGEGWETARRRDDGNDWVEFRLAAPGTVALAELDTRCFVGNAPGWASLRGRAAPDDPWTDLLVRTRLLPDTRHRFRLAAGPEVSHVRLDIYPDGGMARVRLHGEPTAAARADLAARWFAALPAGQQRAVLVCDAGLSPAEADAALAAGPDEVRGLLG